jgi:hypothetical protein
MPCLVNAVIPADQFMIAPALQQEFVDKDTGQFLAYGVVTFYRDADHTQLKPVYTVSGPPDSPIFTELPNPLTLSGIGTFIDPNNGQDIIPYYRPFDDEGNVDLYYITVYSAQNVLQFTRDHYPTINGSSNTVTTQLENILPNGQFLMHLNLPNGGLAGDGSGDGFTDIAYGGWLYRQTPSSSSINYVNFVRYDTPIDHPDQNPRYAVEVKCTFANPGDANKDIFNAITDVNFMQGQALTFQFCGYSNDGNNHNVNFNITQNFGAGGSPEVTVTIATVTITPQIQNFNIPFTMPITTGKTLGTDDRDFIRLSLQSPLASTSDISYTDMILVGPGTFPVLTYPPTSPEQDKAFTLPASFDIPAYDGSDNGKFVIVSHNRFNELGFTYQNAVPTGTIIMSGQPSSIAPSGYLYCDGGGIPISSYPALATAIGFSWGTGVNGFTNVAASSNQFSAIWNRWDVSQIAPNIGTSGFTFSVIQAGVGTVSEQIIRWTVLPGSSITPGTYYTQTVNTTGPAFIQLFWFTVNGVGTIPNVPHDVARQIPILSTDTVTQVRDKLIADANGLIALPDLRGYFPRFWNNGSGRDPDALTRTRAGGPFPEFPYLIPSGDIADSVGSEQPFMTAIGGVLYVNALTPEFALQTGGGLDISIVPAPINQTCPINVYVNGFIKY